VICINLVHGCALHSGTIFILFLRGAILIGPPSQKKKIGTPQQTQLFGPQVTKIRNKYALPFQFFYQGIELWANHTG
jgi:hypothetical protein